MGVAELWGQGHGARTGAVTPDQHGLGDGEWLHLFTYRKYTWWGFFQGTEVYLPPHLPCHIYMSSCNAEGRSRGREEKISPAF